MLNVNRVTLLGHVGRDPEFHSNAAGDRAARFSLATTERWKNRDGEPQERTEWHRIIVFGGATSGWWSAWSGRAPRCSWRAA